MIGISVSVTKINVELLEERFQRIKHGDIRRETSNTEGEDRGYAIENKIGRGLLEYGLKRRLRSRSSPRRLENRG